MEKQNRFEQFEFVELNTVAIADMLKLWKQYYAGYSAGSDLYPAIEDAVLLENYRYHIEDKTGIALKKDGVLVGFMMYDAFIFHGEPSAFVPVTAHAAIKEYQFTAYRLMYEHLSLLWVERGMLHHYFIFLSDDLCLKDLSYNLGFGLYVVDLFRLPEGASCDNCTVEIREAQLEDEYTLAQLIEEERLYYSEAPLFLVKNQEDMKNAREIIEREDCGVFVALDCGEPFGFMAIYKDGDTDIFSLADNHMEAYIREGHRGSGVGDALLAKCTEWAHTNGMKLMHVDFESANVYGNRFWQKHFTPVVYSVKRSVAQDVLT